MDKLNRKLRNIDLGIKDQTKKDASYLGVQGVLAGSQGHSIAQWLAKEFNHNFDDYDSAIDAIYNESHIGGSAYHHLIDGQHSVWGAFKAVKDVKIDDIWVEELAQASEHLLRDLSSVSGINPFFSLTPDQFDKLGSTVSSIGLSKEYLADALTINGPELLGGSIALAGALIMGKKADPSRLSYLSSGCLISSFVSANPLLLPIAAGGMAYAIHKGEDKKGLIIQAGKGSLVSGSSLLVSTLIGGPVWLGCVAGVMAAIAISKGLDTPQGSFDKCLKLIEPARSVNSQLKVNLSGIKS